MMADDGNSSYSYEHTSQRLRENDACLTAVDLSEDSGDVNFVELATLLTNNKNHQVVTRVSLQNLPFSNAAEESAVVSAILSLPNLDRLRLVKVGLSVAGARRLTESQFWSNLRELDLRDNTKLGPRGIKSLAEKLPNATRLETLNLNHCRMGHFGAKALGSSACLPSSLVGLDLGDNGIGNDGSWKLAEALHTLVNLKSLKLCKNQIADEGASEIGRQLTFLVKLEFLDMSNNEIADVGAEVCSSLWQEQICKLAKLDLSDNRIGNQGAISFGRALTHMSSLKELNLGGNLIEDGGAAALAKGLAVHDEASEQTTVLATLSLKDNRISDEGAGVFLEYLDKNRSLVTLDLSGNEISAARLHILEMLMKHRNKPSKLRPKVPATNRNELASALISPQSLAQPLRDDEEIQSEARKLLLDAHAKSAPPEISKAFLDICTNHFQAQCILSYGAFGDLFEGHDTNLQETFAIRKVPVGDDGVLNGIRDRVLRELVTLRFSQHDHIAKLRAYSRDNTIYYHMVYDVSEKMPLDKYIADASRRTQTPWLARVKIILGVASALDFLHSTRSCFHGDVKSANILIGADSTPQLIDCGISRLLATDHERFQRGELVFGSRGYRCPRYERGSRAYGPECDTFSLGIVLAELCTGRLQNHVNAKTKQGEDFYYDYVVTKSRVMVNDLDSSAGPWDTKALATLCKIVLASLDSEPMRRPGSATILKLLSDLSKH